MDKIIKALAKSRPFHNLSEETLKEAYPEIKNKDLNVKPLPGIRGFFANYFGILFKEGKAEREYQKESHKALISLCQVDTQNN